MQIRDRMTRLWATDLFCSWWECITIVYALGGLQIPVIQTLKKSKPDGTLLKIRWSYRLSNWVVCSQVHLLTCHHSNIPYIMIRTMRYKVHIDVMGWKLVEETNNDIIYTVTTTAWLYGSTYVHHMNHMIRFISIQKMHEMWIL